jgi:leader peptidase (prepilin peptidase)/N-methyltransferase
MKQISWYENIPVVSYLALRGACSTCGARIPAVYPLVELAGSALAALSIYRFGLHVNAIFAYGFLMALLSITIIDWRHRIIPDEISLSFILVGLAWSFVNPALSPVESALGALAGGGGLYLVGAAYRAMRHAEGMGGGDIKLMGMVGAFLGIKLVLPVIVIASFFGSLYGIALLRRGGSGRTSVAFGSFLAPSAALCMFFGPYLLSWYFGRF